MIRLLCLFFILLSPAANGSDLLVEIKSKLKTDDNVIVLTLDACGGVFDWDLGHFLVINKIPATIFISEGFIKTNKKAVDFLNKNQDIFHIANHGKRHFAPVYRNEKIYGVPSVIDRNGLIEEIGAAESAIKENFNVETPYYRGATAVYSQLALNDLVSWGRYPVGYSISIDGGGRKSGYEIIKTLSGAKRGDVLLGHINRPDKKIGYYTAIGISNLINSGFKIISIRDSINYGGIAQNLIVIKK